MNLKTTAFYFHRLREIITFALEAESQVMFVGEIEVDESYFGDKVYTKIIPDASSAILMPIIERKSVPDSIVYSDGWRGYNVLDASNFHHFRMNRSKLFADNRNHINGIENFRTRRSANSVSPTVFSRPISPYSRRNASGVPTTATYQTNYRNSDNGLNDIWASYLGQPQTVHSDSGHY